jgi:hypothetical protein
MDSRGRDLSCRNRGFVLPLGWSPGEGPEVDLVISSFNNSFQSSQTSKLLLQFHLQSANNFCIGTNYAIICQFTPVAFSYHLQINMAFLSKISNLIASQFTRFQPPDAIAGTDGSASSQLAQGLQHQILIRKPRDEPRSYASYSIVDGLMARATNRASHELYADGEGVIENEWDIDMTEVVTSIEVHHQEQKRPARLQASNATVNSDRTSPGPHSPLSGQLPGHEYHPAPEEKLKAIDEAIDVRAKYELQIAQCVQMIQQGWEEDTILAYLKLDRRGFEPLFPSTWKIDFVLFPPILFTEDVKNAFVRSVSGKDWRAVHEFDNFCKVGTEVRVSQINHTYPARRPEAMLTKYLKNYLKWAWWDAGLAKDLELGRLPQLIAVKCAKHREIHNPDRAEILQERLLMRLRSMGDKLLELLKFAAPSTNDSEYLIDPPTLFGFAVLDSLVGIVAYEPLTRTSRTIGFFNFDDRHLEVMNTISLAILIHWVRYGLIRLRDVLEEQPESEMSWSAEDTSHTSDGPVDSIVMSDGEETDPDA